MGIATKLRRNRDEKLCQSKKLTNILRRRCHTCDTKLWKVATKKCGNSDENVWQTKNLRRRCYMCNAKPWKSATNFRRYCHACSKTIHYLTTNYRLYFRTFFKFKIKKIYMRSWMLGFVIDPYSIFSCVIDPSKGFLCEKGL
jgi:hypothetical protein